MPVQGHSMLVTALCCQPYELQEGTAWAELLRQWRLSQAATQGSSQQHPPWVSF